MTAEPIDMGASPMRRPSFVDPNLKADTYYYVVQAVDAWGQRSAPSSPPLRVDVP